MQLDTMGKLFMTLWVFGLILGLTLLGGAVWVIYRLLLHFGVI